METPFNHEYLDELMEAQGVDLVLANTKFNIQYLFGGYKFFFFANMDAIGLGRYLPLLGYRRGHVDQSFYVGAGNENWGTDVWDMWVGELRNESWSSVRSAEIAAELIVKRGLAKGTIAVEQSFLPSDAMDVLRAQLPDAHFVSAQLILEELRAVKSPAELQLIRESSEKIVASFVATFGRVKVGMNKAEIAEVLKQEAIALGLDYDYALVACGTDFNRAPTSRRVWAPGEVLSLDSGGMYHGYIGDLARMSVANEPTGLQTDVLAEIERVQQAARTVIKAGNLGSEIHRVARAALAESPFAPDLHFVGHAMGLISHEAPRLTSTGPIPYPATHASLPLRAGMVLSIETWAEHPEAGFIKLEDTLLVTDDGWEAPGDTARAYTPSASWD